VVFNNPWDRSVWQVERYIKKHLYDAGSYEAVEWGAVSVTAKGYQVRCKFRSKNLLGATVLQSKQYYLSAKGDVYAVRD
jgi:hypothetical protein